MLVVGRARWCASANMSSTRATGIAFGVVCAPIWGCSGVTDLSLAINGTYSLASVTGRGPATGTLVLTRQGYAERRVRFRELGGALSREYLARGTAEFQSDSTILLTLREMDPASPIPWTPDARFTGKGVQIVYYDVVDGSEIVETYRRQ
jgi:hypothetical protein